MAGGPFANTRGQVEYKHFDGEISHFRISVAGLGVRRVRITDLPPEVSDQVIQTAFSCYGTLREVQAEQWAQTYR
jgi:hypothetical protein